MTPMKKPLTFADFNKRACWLGQQLSIALWSERLRWSGLEIIDDELMTRTRSNIPHHELHNVLATRISRTSLGRDLDRCLTILASEPQPSRWFLNAHNQESEITEQLIARGFDNSTSFSIVATDIELSNGPSAWQNMAHETHTVSQLASGAELKSWVEVLAGTYEFSTDLPNTWLDMLLACGTGHDQPWRYYLCYVDKKPVGALSALWTDQVMTIEVVCVLPKHQGCGVGPALIYQALSDAQNAGYKVAAACPLSEIKGVYEHYGFSRVGAIDCVTTKTEQLAAYKHDAGLGMPDQAVAPKQSGMRLISY